MEITDNRLQHLHMVAKRMSEYVGQHSGKFNCNPEEMYILGLLHDVGYAFVDKQENHAKVAGELLREQGYKYWREVYYHGVSQDEYDSIELRLLNYIDITTGPTGDVVSIDEKIEDIKVRYGKSSYQASEAIKLAEMLRLKPL